MAIFSKGWGSVMRGWMAAWLLVCVAGWAGAQSAPTRADGATTPRANVAALLADPVTSHSELRFLLARRAWLARQEGNLDAFAQVAGEFEQRGAFYPAVEI